MSVFARVARGRLAAWLTVAVALVVGAAIFGLPKPANPALRFPPARPSRSPC
jgi:putative drug exporter of the RND superfamily